MKILLLLLALVPAGAFANNCAKDAERLCGGIDPGKNQIYICLSNYESQLTSACKQELKEFRKKTESKNPCFADLADYCSDVEGEKIQYCLLKNESRLSPACAADFKGKKGSIIVKDKCALDIVNTCYKEVPGKDGAINKCLFRNRPKLSKFCQNSVDVLMTKIRKDNPCFDEQEKLCPTQSKFADIHECLEKKISSLSPACKTVVQKEQKKMNANPCYKELTKFCKPDLSPNGQIKCLTLHDKELSSSCRQYRAVMDEKVKKMVTACETDRLKFCAKAPLKDGMVLKCLRNRKPELSTACRNLM